MRQADQDLVRAGLERHLAVVESLIPARPPWRAIVDLDDGPARVRVVAGPAVRDRGRGDRRLGLLVAVGAVAGALLAYALLGGGSRPSLVPSDPTSSPSATSTPAPTIVAGALQPAIEPRLIIRVRPTTAWVVVADDATVLNLAHVVDAVGSSGYNGLMIVEPHAVYDPVAEGIRLPLPADLIAWIRDHPDLESGEPTPLTVAGMPATAIDVTVTYPADGPKGQTAQFIDIGPGSWNLESPSRKRIVLVQLPDRPLLIVFESWPEFFDAGIAEFEDVLRRIQFEDRGPAP